MDLIIPVKAIGNARKSIQCHNMNKYLAHTLKGIETINSASFLTAAGARM